MSAPKIDWKAEAEKLWEQFCIGEEIDPGALDGDDPVRVDDVLTLLATAMLDAYKRGLDVHVDCVTAVVGKEAELRDGSKLVAFAPKIVTFDGDTIRPDVCLTREAPEGSAAATSPRKRP